MSENNAGAEAPAEAPSQAPAEAPADERTPQQKAAATRAANKAAAEAAASNGAPAEAGADALNLLAQARAERISKARRVYVDVVPRFGTADGTLATVQRERRADGTLGEYQAAEIRKGKDGAPDSVTHWPMLRVQSIVDTLRANGVTIIE